MASITRWVAAAPDIVFAALSHPPIYGGVVVGAARVRHFDPRWPAPDTSFHHTLGVGPIRVGNRTTVVEVDPPSRLVLDAGFRPVAISRMAFAVFPDGIGSTVQLDMRVVGGPLARMWNPALDAVLDRRNRLLLRRLAAEAERRDAARRRAQAARRGSVEGPTTRPPGRGRAPVT